jgi:hypothetical protein
MTDINCEKQKILAMFNILKRRFPQYIHQIPVLSMDNDLKFLKDSYEATAKSLGLQSKSASYMFFFNILLDLCQANLGNVFKIDMTGFKEMHLKEMHKYDAHFLELIEKYDLLNKKSKMSVEFQLIFLFITQTAIFVFCQKFIPNLDILKYFIPTKSTKSTNEEKSQNETTSSKEEKKPKMKGPINENE